MYPEKKRDTDLDALVKKEMIDRLTDRIKNNKQYNNYLLNTRGIYDRTLAFLNGAIEVYEQVENYEDCKFLLNFRKSIELNESQTI